MKAADLDAVLTVMSKHGATRVVCDDFEVDLPARPAPQEEHAIESEFERFSKLSPEKQAELMRARELR